MNVNLSRTRANAGFTLVEIAISIAVVAFALVAIIGVLPTGMQVQKENREETMINQDAPLLLEAIRTGSTNIDNLAGNLEYIINYVSNTNGVTWSPLYLPRIDALPPNAPAAGFLSGFGLIPPTTGLPPALAQYQFHSGARDIVGHMSFPSYLDHVPPFTSATFSNSVIRTRARFLANGGAPLALEAPGARKLAFSYIVIAEVTPHTRIGGPPGSGILYSNLHDIRLEFQWPVRGAPDPATEIVGKNRKVFRTTVAGQFLPEPDLDPTPGNQSSNYFCHPLQYGIIQP